MSPTSIAARAVLALAALFTCGALTACAATPRTSSADAAAQFERLKRLEGAWVVVNGSEGAPAGAEIRYRVSAGGSALVETIMPGAEHEMVSVYHTADGQLVMTHYCSAGNQPRMVAEPSQHPDQIAFECVGGSNVDRKRGLYMRSARFEFLSDARVDATWSAVQDGKPHHTVRFELVRSWK